MLGIGLMIGSMGLDIYGTLERNKELERRADYEKEELYKRSAFLGSMAQEKLYDLAVEKNYAKGALKAAQASAGIKVGTGSAISQTSSLEGQFRRKMEIIEKKVGFEKAMMYREAGEIEKRSEQAQEAGWWELGSSLLSKGYGLGISEGWWGATA